MRVLQIYGFVWTLTLTYIDADEKIAVCEPRSQSHPDYSKCPTKTCKQHIDCWVSFGMPQSCVCDPHLCGPVCLAENAKCPQPNPPLHGTVHFNETNVADTAEYHCGAGLVVRGPRTRYCLATLEWSGEEPSCSNQTNTCFSPPDIPNAYLSAHRNSGLTFKPDGQRGTSSDPTRADYRSGEVIEIRCLPGYRDERRDYVEASCIGSEWHYAQLNCERIHCDSLKEPQHGRIVYRTDKRFQAEAITVCVEGYTADCETWVGTDKHDNGCVRICQSNGEWSGVDSLCKPVTCPRLDAPQNGGLSTYTVSVHSTVHFHCNEGFEMEGSKTRKCQPNGKWDGTPVLCKERDCGKPPEVAQAKLLYNATTFGSRVNFKCAPDTTPSVSEPMLICGTMNNQTIWLPSPTPRCNRHCYLFTVDHGDVILMHHANNRSQPRLIPITSDAYGNFGDVNGNTQGPSPSADGIILSGGRVRHDAQLNVTCHSGFQLAQPKSPVTTCKDGVWSIRSKCIPASCNKRPPIARGARVRFYSRQHNAKARYECFAGFKLQVDVKADKAKRRTQLNDPLGTIRCLHGEWVGTPVYCEPTRCPRLVVDKMMSIEMKPLIPYSAEHQLENEALQGTQAFLHCPKGHHIQGPPVVVCHEGKWLPSTDVHCEKTVYPILPIDWLFRLP